MKIYLTFILLIYAHLCISQQSYDTLIKTPYYNSYYSLKYKLPVAVSYILYKGGGNSSRNGMDFKDEGKKYATSKDYSKSGYDKGHMVPAKDFASDPIKLESTFRFYNCIPQTPELNRGEWAKLEEDVRRRSQKDSLFIICYNHFSDKKMNRVTIPDTCYKIVFVIKNGNYLYESSLSGCFENNNNPVLIPITKDILNNIKKNLK